MKFKKSTISTFILASVLCLTNIGTINAQGTVEDVSTHVIVGCPNNNCQKIGPCKDGRKSIFMKSIQELQENGTLSEKDVENIKEFKRKEKEELRQKVLEERFKKIDKMVNEKIITKEQGTKLKETIEKNIQNLDKDTNKSN